MLGVSALLPPQVAPCFCGTAPQAAQQRPKDAPVSTEILPPSDWLFGCCGSRIQRCAETALAPQPESSRPRQSAEARPLLRGRSSGGFSSSRLEAKLGATAEPGSANVFLTEAGCNVPLSSSSLALPELPVLKCRSQPLVSSSSELIKPRSPSRADPVAPKATSLSKVEATAILNLSSSDATTYFCESHLVPAEGDNTRTFADNTVDSKARIEAEARPTADAATTTEFTTALVPAGGTTRVLLSARPLAYAPCAGSPNRAMQDNLQRLEHWCRRCGLDDVTSLCGPLDVPRAVLDLAERCQPGDTCVLVMAGGSSSSSSMVTSTVGSGDLERQACLLGPEVWFGFRQSTVVCISTYAGDPAAMPSLPQTLEVSRAVHFCLAVEDANSSAKLDVLCLVAMLRAADALSLADGPCSLSCQDFFAEMAEQAQDLAASSGLSSLATRLAGSPQDLVAAAVRWPVAALPRELARTVGTNGSFARQETPSRPAGPIVAPRAAQVSSAHGFRLQSPLRRPSHRSASSPKERLSALVRQAAAAEQVPNRKNSVPGTASHSRRPRSSCSRAMPSNFGSLSLMLSGGGGLIRDAGTGEQISSAT